MHQNYSPISIYQQEKEKHATQLQSLLKKQNLLSWTRLFVFVATALLSYKVFVSSGWMGWIVIGIGVIGFLIAVSIDTDNKRKIIHIKNLISINEDELEILNNNYYNRYDGSNYIPSVHDYANDLDVFGKASLFQYINRCYTEQGKNLLAQNLLHPLSASAIAERHEAMKEIMPLYTWRQQLQSVAVQTPITKATQQKIEAWLLQEETSFTHPKWKIIVPVYSTLTLASAVAALFGFIPYNFFSFLFIIYLVIASRLSKKATQAYTQLSGIVSEIDVLFDIMQWIESTEFHSQLLQRLQLQVKVNDGNTGLQIKQLKGILNRFDLRLNVFVFFFLNSFLLWDVRQIRALNTWRQKNKSLVPKWFQLIAELEVLNSLSTLHFNQPDWCLPEFNKAYFTLDVREVGHPLIPAIKRIVNNFYLQGSPMIGLITGSNMAGKSTFLRSLGVNIILAQMGAPVCAKQFILSPVHLMSSMRIEDNLAENTSTFYAELKKLKTIIESVNKQEPLFILLDEILRGTNSLDRHTGSKALIHQLIRKKAVAVIATHDIELAGLQQEFPQSINNYNFDVQVEGEELYFDYKLKEGVCTSLNASILMKKIGIEL